MKRVVLAIAALGLLGGAAMAQGQGGGFGGPPPQGGFQGGPGGGGRQGGPGGRGMGMRQVSAATLSLRTMLTYLGLSDAQAVKIALIKEDAQQNQRPGGPGGFGGPGGGPGGFPGGPPQGGDFQGGPPQPGAEGQGGFQNAQVGGPQGFGGPGGGGRQGGFGGRGQGGRQGGMPQVDDTKTVAAINTVLSDAQKTKLKQLIKAAQSLAQSGIRPDSLAKLKLTEQQLAALARGEQADGVLSEAQVSIAEEFRMPQFGGPGGPGGFPGGPPPDGGFGGPPPTSN